MREALEGIGGIEHEKGGGGVSADFSLLLDSVPQQVWVQPSSEWPFSSKGSCMTYDLFSARNLGGPGGREELELTRLHLGKGL